MLGKLPVPGRPAGLDYSGTWASVLAEGAGGSCLDISFSRVSFLLSFSPSVGDGPIWTEILSQRAVKPKTINQPIGLSSALVPPTLSCLVCVEDS